MMEQATGNYFLNNSNVFPTARFNEIYTTEGIRIFEVFRVISGIPVFLEEHLVRLQLSSEKAGLNLAGGFEGLYENILRFIKLNELVSGNVKIVAGLKNGLPDIWIFSIPFKYPSESDYFDGVPLSVLFAERTNPTAKIIQENLRAKANNEIAAGKVYEVLLADSHGFITEGSRSNVFFVTRSQQLVTPPENRVLNGITRQKVILLAATNHIDLIEEEVNVSDLNRFDAAFITGTSPKLLAANSIGELPFNPGNPVYTELKAAYNKLLDDYIRQKAGRR